MVGVTKMIQAAKDFELGLQFFAEAQKINVKGAKRFHKRLKKIDNAFMNKQLFETDKTEVMIINEDDEVQCVAALRKMHDPKLALADKLTSQD
eukprot:5542655-Prymnesium_polylepis.1